MTKLKQEVTLLTWDVAIHKPSPTACNHDVTTLKQEITIVPQDVTTLEQEVTKNIQDFIIHRRIPTIFKRTIQIKTRDEKTKSRNWSQYEKIADYVFKGFLLIISLMKYFKEP